MGLKFRTKGWAENSELKILEEDVSFDPINVKEEPPRKATFEFLLLFVFSKTQIL